MSRFVESRIEAAQKIMSRIEGMKGGCKSEDYIYARAELNLELVQAIVGGKIITKDSRFKGTVTKIRYTERPATKKELAAIIAILSDFEYNVEQPLLNAFTAKIEEMGDEESMDIIPSIAMIDEADFNELERANTKKFNQVILGSNESSSGVLASSRITSSNIMELAAYAEDLRKRQNRNKLLIAGGIVLAGVGVGVATKIIYDKKKAKEQDLLGIEEGSVDLDLPTTIDTDLEVPAGSEADLDVPVVSLD